MEAPTEPVPEETMTKQKGPDGWLPFEELPARMWCADTQWWEGASYHHLVALYWSRSQAREAHLQTKAMFPGAKGRVLKVAIKECKASDKRRV